jgi:chromosome segregation ATPase
MTAETAETLIEKAARFEAVNGPAGTKLALKLRELADVGHTFAQTSLKGRVYAALEAARWRPEHALRAVEKEIATVRAQIEAANAARTHAAELTTALNRGLAHVRADFQRQKASLMGDRHAAEHNLRRLTDQRRAAVATLTAAGLTTDEAEARAKPTADEVAAAAERAEAALPAQIAAVEARMKDTVGLAKQAEARQRAEAAEAARKTKERERVRAQARLEAAADAAVAAAEV